MGLTFGPLILLKLLYEFAPSLCQVGYGRGVHDGDIYAIESAPLLASYYVAIKTSLIYLKDTVVELVFFALKESFYETYKFFSEDAVPVSGADYPVVLAFSFCEFGYESLAS